RGAQRQSRGSKADGIRLYATPMYLEEPNSATMVPEAITGLAVREALFWSTRLEVRMAPRDGAAGGSQVLILGAEELRSLEGQSAEIRDIEVSSDGLQVYVAVHSAGVSQSCSIYMLPAKQGASAEGVKLTHAFTEDIVSLSLGANGFLFVASPLTIHEAPAPFSQLDVPRLIFSLVPKESQRVVGMRALFVRGADCEVADFADVGVCSETCGGGRYRQERQVLVEARDGGKPCPSPMEQYRDCNTQHCPVNALDCMVGQ
ncbi:unnamed protein product, partial [Polarella glacialis]